MRSKLIFVLLISFTILCFSQHYENTTVRVRSSDHSDFTRIVFEFSSRHSYNIKKKDDKIILFLEDRLNQIDTSGILYNSALIEKITSYRKSNQTTFEILINENFSIKNEFILNKPYRIVIDIIKQTLSPYDSLSQSSTPTQDFAQKPERKKFEFKDETLPPIKKKRREIQTICIDPGHGGNDIGAEGKSGILEKDITLKIGRKLKNLINLRRGINVILTRDSDDEISLNQRAATANNNKANLFISIHINGSYRSSVRGPEIYFASLKATDTRSFNLAKKENQYYTKENETINDDTLNMILWNMAQTQYIKESSLLAEAVQEKLNILLDTVNRGVKQAPFRVLMRANMPAILIEVAFISNTQEERKLSQDSFLNKVALSIYQGIEKYISYYNSQF